MIMVHTIELQRDTLLILNDGTVALLGDWTGWTDPHW